MFSFVSLSAEALICSSESRWNSTQIHFSDSEDNTDVLVDLENIDDELDAQSVPFVKTDDLDAAAEYGIDTLPR